MSGWRSNFTANGTQSVVVRFTNTGLNNNTMSNGSLALLNGFQIDAFPGPSSALLGGLGLLALLRRRR